MSLNRCLGEVQHYCSEYKQINAQMHIENRINLDSVQEDLRDASEEERCRVVTDVAQFGA